ncbi:MAG: glutamine synthetase type III, partial [Oscillospiraceae bacterium]|nr:glutamine synthetase type III [Oscillospiraceae bacterium]
TDHNQLTMEIMQKVAARHGLVCLLHEKPFAGVNGSGKHNNWSISTDAGQNLLSPGETPYENAQFLLFLIAVLEAVDEYADLLRASVATAGNDHRLGANEAPPAVVSVFLGDELTAVLEALEREEPYIGTAKPEMMLGVLTLPRFLRDTTDRNRTSPFAFTGNKFEFRMVGSSNSIACANIMLNAAVADTLGKFADALEGASDFDGALHALLLGSLKAHKRILFNGNGYDEAWIREAVEDRGLHNLRTTPDAMKALLEEKNMDMLIRQKVYTEAELRSRYEIMLENYCKTIVIEANTMSEMARRQILPAVERYAGAVAESAAKKLAVVPVLTCSYEKHLVQKLSALSDQIEAGTEALESTLASLSTIEDIPLLAEGIRDLLLPKMAELRASADEAECLTAREFWPFPTYGEILFG